MKHQRQLLAVSIAVMMLSGAGCASGKTALPPVDPVKEQITILQKQLLELQSVQNESQRKLNEQTNLLDSMSSRLKMLEEQRTAAQRIPSSQLEPKQNTVKSNSPDKKKSANTAKKKKKRTKPVRRQEP